MTTATIQTKADISHIRHFTNCLRTKILAPQIRFMTRKTTQTGRMDAAQTKGFARYGMYSVCRFLRYDPGVSSTRKMDCATENVCREWHCVRWSDSFRPYQHMHQWYS
jgi:hypothetical protein